MGSAKFQSKLMDLQSNMLNFAYMLTSNRDDAYDLLQDTTLKALDSEDKFTEDANFKGWGLYNHAQYFYKQLPQIGSGGNICRHY